VSATITASFVIGGIMGLFYLVASAVFPDPQPVHTVHHITADEYARATELGPGPVFSQNLDPHRDPDTPADLDSFVLIYNTRIKLADLDRPGLEDVRLPDGAQLRAFYEGNALAREAFASIRRISHVMSAAREFLPEGSAALEELQFQGMVRQEQIEERLFTDLAAGWDGFEDMTLVLPWWRL
jgi:hypothetical protein